MFQKYNKIEYKMFLTNDKSGLLRSFFQCTNVAFEFVKSILKWSHIHWLIQKCNKIL